MKTEDFKAGQRVVVVGKIYHGKVGRVTHTGNGTIYVKGPFSKGFKNADLPRGFSPEDLVHADTQEGMEAAAAKEKAHRFNYGPDPRYGGADVTT